MGELLCKASRSVDPLNDLLRKDVWITVKKVDGVRHKVLNIRLKSSKESRVEYRGVVVEVFENRSKYCPVVAYLRYVHMCGGGRMRNAAFRSNIVLNCFIASW